MDQKLRKFQSEDVKKCLEEKPKRVVFAGDSRLRYLFVEILKLSDNKTYSHEVERLL